MAIDSPFGWRGGSGGGIVLFELLDGYITQKFVDVGRKKDGARRPSGVGSSSGRGSGRSPKLLCFGPLQWLGGGVSLKLQ